MKPPKFKISVALNDMNAINEPMTCSDAYKNVTLALYKLSDAVSHHQLAPIPPNLKGSLYDPEMLDLRNDDEFRQIYKSDFQDTAEECVAQILYTILRFDLAENKRCHTKPRTTSLLYDYTVGDVLYNMRNCADKLSRTYMVNCNDPDDVAAWLGLVYINTIQFAEKLRMDLNVFLRWYLRYKLINH